MSYVSMLFNFRVKTFVCTDGGCTESEYSQPLRTGNEFS